MNTLDTSIIRHAIDGEEINAVDARELHAFLEVGKDFSTWIKDRIDQYGFAQGKDYVVFDSPVSGNQKGRGGDRRSIGYALTIDMAKEVAMVERNEKGKQARLYFIEMEREAKTLATLIPQSLPDALRYAALLAEKAAKAEREIKELAPKAAFHDNVCKAINAQTISEAAKMLGTGQNRFFEWLREKKILMEGFRGGEKNKPYQQYIDQGYFRVTERQYTDDKGESHLYTRTLITGKGFAWLERLWRGGSSPTPN